MKYTKGKLVGGVVISVVALVAISYLVTTWLAMLILGALSHIFNNPSLALSFWQSSIVWVIVFFINILFRK